MPTANLNNVATTVDTSNDSIVIVDNFQSKRGGATLDVTGWTPDTIPGGHPIIKETSTGNLKPMPVTGSALAALPASHTYYGILISTITLLKPFAGIMVRGTVNPSAMKYTGFATIQAAFTTAVPAIDFRAD